MTDDYRRVMDGFTEVMRTHAWDRLGEFVADDAVWEYPQSRERFRGLANIRGQLENYPALEPGSSELTELVGGARYALTPNYTLVAIDGTSDSATAIVRASYPDGSHWWVVNLYEVRDGKIARSRSYFAPEFDPPDWRAPYREPIA